MGYPPQGAATGTSSGDFFPPDDNLSDLGKPTNQWRNFYFGTAIVGGAVGGNWNPDTDDNWDLGESVTPLEWKNIYIDGKAYLDELGEDMIIGDELYLVTGIVDDDFWGIKAVDNDDQSLKEVIRFQGAADPYVAMGGSQEFQFFNSGVATFGGAVTIGDTLSINTGILDDDYYTLNAVDNDDQSLTEVARVMGGTDPGFSIGSNQEFAVFKSGNMTAGGDIIFATNKAIRPTNGDNTVLLFKARDNTVGSVEIARLQSAVDPFVQIGRNDTNVADGSVTDNLLILGGRGGVASANGTGVGIAFFLGNDQATPENQKRGALNFVLTDQSNGSEKAEFHVWTMTGGALNQAFKVDDVGELYADLDGTSASYLTNGVNLFDEYDDVEELRRFQLTVPNTGLVTEEQRLANRQRLVELGVVAKKEEGEGYHMKIQSMFRLVAGGIYQTRVMLEDVREDLLGRLDAIELELGMRKC